LSDGRMIALDERKVRAPRDTAPGNTRQRRL